MLFKSVELYSTSFLLLLLANGELNNCPKDCGLWFDGCNFCLCHDDQDKGLEAGCTNLTCDEVAESFCASQREDIVEDDVNSVDESQEVLDAVCEDDPNWVDDQYDGDGASKCSDLKFKWCYNYGAYSAEARRACPKTCGVCMPECSDVSSRVRLGPYNNVGCFSKSWPLEDMPSSCARSYVVRKAGGSFYNVPCAPNDDGEDQQWTCSENWDCATLHSDQAAGGFPQNITTNPTVAPIVAPNEPTPSPVADLTPAPTPEQTPAPSTKPAASQFETVEVAKKLRGLSKEQAMDTAPAMQEALKQSGISATVTVKSVVPAEEEASQRRRRRLSDGEAWKVTYNVEIEKAVTSRDKLLETVTKPEFDDKMSETIEDDLRIEVDVQAATVALEDPEESKEKEDSGSNMAVLGAAIGGSVVLLGCIGFFVYKKGFCDSSARRRSSGGSTGGSGDETAGFKYTKQEGEGEAEYTL